MPPIVRYAAAYGAGLWAGLSLFGTTGVLVIPALGVLALAAVRPREVAWWALAAGMVVGGIATAFRAGWCTNSWRPGTVDAVIRLADHPSGRGMARGTVVRARSGCGGPVMLRFASGEMPSGAALSIRGSFLPPNMIRVREYQVLNAAPGIRYRLRDAVGRRIEQLYGARAPLVEALVLGRRGDVDLGIRRAFADAGLAHLLAISGLHVGLLAGWMALLARRLSTPARAWSWAAAGTWLYVIILGFPAPATRAASFITLHAVARLRQRHPGPESVLAVAAMVVLTVDPDAIRSVGAWLSVTAVWGTGVAHRALGTHARHPVASLLTASVGATVATAPITALVFGAVAPVGIVTNLVAVPLAGVAVPGVFASLFAGEILAGGAGAALATLERVAEWGARVPGGHLAGTAGAAMAAPWTVALLFCAWVVHRRPAWRLIGLRLLGLLAVVVWVPVVTGQVQHRERHTGLAIYMLDVGQGDAILMRTPRGRWVVVDAGPRMGRSDAGRSVVLPFLRRHGARSLDLIVVSHGDADHLGGVPALLEALPTRLVLDPGQALGSRLFSEYHGALVRWADEWAAARTGDTIIVDGVEIAVLHPSASWAAREARPNENSVVVAVRYGEFDALLTGDIGWPAESALVASGRARGPVELLKVAHHGSAGGTYDAWLDAVRPRMAIVSAGRGNRFGHPAPAVVRRLEDRGIPLFRTDRHGTVTIRVAERYFEVVRDDRDKRLIARLTCRIQPWLRLKASSWSRNACTPRPPESSPTFFMMWPSPPR